MIAAIILTFIVDRIGLSLGFSIYFSHTAYPSINANIHPILNWTSLAGNLAFFQTVYTPVWGTDGPLWSLMYEWWFYVLYIPIFWLFRKNRLVTSVIVLLLWIASIEFSFSPALLSIVLSYFIAWYMGMMLADVLLNKIISVTGAALYLVVILLFSVLRYTKADGWDIALAVAITCLLFALLTTNALGFLKKLSKVGEFSYTLYIIHVPIICLLSGYIMHTQHNLPMHSYYVVLGIIIALVVAWPLHLITERPFTKKASPRLLPNQNQNG